VSVIEVSSRENFAQRLLVYLAHLGQGSSATTSSRSGHLYLATPAATPGLDAGRDAGRGQVALHGQADA
jgi:hypothetical protein